MHQPYLHMILKGGDTLSFRSEFSKKNILSATAIDPKLRQFIPFFGAHFQVANFSLVTTFRYPNPFSIPMGIYSSMETPSLSLPGLIQPIQIPIKYLELPAEVYAQRTMTIDSGFLDFPGPLLTPIQDSPFEVEDLVEVNGFRGVFRVNSLAIKSDKEELEFFYILSPSSICLAPNDHIVNCSIGTTPKNLSLHSPGRVSRYFTGERITFSSLEDELLFHFFAGATERTTHKPIDDLENFISNQAFTPETKATLIYTRLQEGKADFVFAYDYSNDTLSIILDPTDLPTHGILTFMRFKDKLLGNRLRNSILENILPPSTIAEA